MKYLLSPLALVFALSAWAQTPPTPAASELAKLPPDAVYATVSGRKVTVAEMRQIMRRVTQPGADPKEILRQTELVRTLAREAEQEKLDAQSPWKEDIEWNRLQVLAVAQINEYYKKVTIAPQDQKDFYEANKNRFEQAKVRMIYVAFSANPKSHSHSDSEKKHLSEAEAKSKIDGLRKQAIDGGDFAKLATANSDDPTSAAKGGDFGQPIRRSDKLPEPVKSAIFALKAGEISEPVRQPNGFYLFRLEEVSTIPYEKVQNEIFTELKSLRHRNVMEKKTASIDVKLESPASPASANPGGAASAR